MKDDLKKMLLNALKNGDAKGIGIPIPFSAMSSMFEHEEDKTQIGKLSPEVFKKFKKVIKDKDDLDEEVDIMVKQLELELKRKIDVIFGERMEAVEDRRKEIWDEIADYLSVSRDINLSIDRTNGMVSGSMSKPNLTVVKGSKGDETTPH